MDKDSVRVPDRHYHAFVSYSHADARFARWLHRRLERQRQADHALLAPIFIDRAELVAGPDLSAQVRTALAGSAALIVVASPAARASRWVELEIALFRELHPDRPIYAALIDGEPDEAFPPGLLVRDGMAVEPLAADFRKGQDGRRLGVLKIAAGLTGQPLDRLVQRDATSRQRRVMAITAGALLLSVILATALIAAIQARAEAERQRADAEGLVEFMLTDLRDKLKGVGRLDVMDAVNQRVLRRYAGEANLSNLPDAEQLRRAKLLHAMTEDDLSSLNRFDRADEEARAAAKITGTLISRSPTQADFMLAHARSEYWLGQVKFLDRGHPPATRAANAQPHWLEYRRLTLLLAQRRNPQPEWLVEASYAEGNLCALALEEPRQRAMALQYCEAATRQLEAARRLRPRDTDILLNLATAYAWQADANASNGNPREALALRRRQMGLVAELASLNPDDMRVSEARLLASFGLSKVLIELGDMPAALQHLDQAEKQALALRAHDPGNSDWGNWLKQIGSLKKQAHR
ncbi:MAG: toll/interleukin-1 receptor domain-containing protein [Sphingomonadales bacterium]|nr:toll/interleukin-1 receptor domain-containing protein [Sphingomonadales bacterium]